MEHTETLAPVSTSNSGGPLVDWAAVIAGAVVAAAIAALFMTFGAALGLSTISAERGEGSFSLWIIVTGLWLVITLTLSYLAGGYITGRMRRRVETITADEIAARDGINGLVVWALGMLVTAWMAAAALSTAATTAGQVVGGATEAAGAALGGAAQGLGSAVPEDAISSAIDRISDTLGRPVLSTTAPAAAGTPAAPGTVVPSTPAEDPSELTRQSASILAGITLSGEVSDADRAYLTGATARLSGVEQGEVEARVDAAIASAQEIRTEAGRLADEAETAARDAAETARVSAILTAFILTAAALVAGAAAVAGAVRGGRHRDEGRLFGGLSYRL